MKRRGSLMEYSQERIESIMHIYDEYISSCEYIDTSYICKHIANMPAPRFWVSSIWASKMMYAMFKGSQLKNMLPSKREMFQEIFRRVKTLRKLHPNWTIKKCCEIVVEQPAPKFYLTAESIGVMICKEKKRRFEERKKRLRHCF
ncbi:hypothetical protein [Prevotella bivia]|uniref:hypothetical protein n=1 Tax=Prevotella bivia TaxID=28125 RepID=UPI00288B8A63|nr:hypothetical protein [Prevotella bivia]